MIYTSLIEQNLILAELIALEYLNIPSCSHDEVKSEANLGLIRAAEAYDPEKGEFSVFASKVIRNSLNSLYSKQIRLLNNYKRSAESSLSGVGDSRSEASDTCELVSLVDDKADVIRDIRINETSEALCSVMKLLTPREQLAIRALKSGCSYTEIGSSMTITKQAAHKLVHSGLDKLRSGLAKLGYKGIATDGLLGSSFREKSSN